MSGSVSLSLSPPSSRPLPSTSLLIRFCFVELPSKEGTNVQGQKKIVQPSKCDGGKKDERVKQNFCEATSSPGHDIAFGPEVQVVQTLPLVSLLFSLSSFTLDIGNHFSFLHILLDPSLSLFCASSQSYLALSLEKEKKKKLIPSSLSSLHFERSCPQTGQLQPKWEEEERERGKR